MKTVKRVVWPLVAATALSLALYFLYQKLHGLTWQEFENDLRSIPPHHYGLALFSTCVAYFALAWYDRLALIHLNIHHISWLFISLCSFTTYALGHNLGASVFSGAVVRYRAYTSKGLSPAQIAVLVTLCTFTFALGVVILSGCVLTIRPDLLARIQLPEDSPLQLPGFLTDPLFARTVGLLMLGFVAAYIIGSLMQMRPLHVRGFLLEYPRPKVMVRQLLVGPLELLGAAGIIYSALPDAGNPGYIAVLGVFLASFSVALVSNVPGGVGVFEALFIAAMPEIDKSQVLAALVVFRAFYFIIPLIISLFIIAIYERMQYKERERREAAGTTG
ncbi:MAG: lysylphosphatidylglycerol synthase domain-containing protein [Methylobacteriaceae bacterium]|jgi:uncharacterized membrane protein YbhN (UPF0104 family)|nr:lysylphosphatidylglycerol synthase domain-containing protein [Methylobacteriaceae bacterium]